MKHREKIELIKGRFEVLPVFTALFALGIAASGLFSTPIYLVFLFVTIGCLLLSLVEQAGNYRFYFLCAGAIAAGLFYGNICIVNFTPSDFLKLDGTRGTLTGSFTGDYQTFKSGTIQFNMNKATYEFDKQSVKIPGIINCRVAHAELLPEPEQTYALPGSFIAPEPGQLPAFKSKTMTPVKNFAYAQRLAGKLQSRIRLGLNSVLPRRHAAIITGFILGDTSQLSKEDRQLFRETGISHLLAVSGQHIMVVIMLLAAVLYWLKIPPISRSIVITVILVGYALTTSGSPSIWRALTMYICVAAVLHLEAFPSPIRPVSIACLLLLLHDPAVIFSAAFQLSFTAVLSIILLREPFEWLMLRIKLPDFLSRYLAVTFAANFGTMPMTAFLFGTVSASAILVNPLILWSFCYILPMAFLTAFLAIVWPSSAIIVASGLSLFLDGLIALLQKFNAMPGSFFYVGNFPGITIATVYSLMLLAAAKFNAQQIVESCPIAMDKGMKTDNEANEPLPIIKKPKFGNPESATRTSYPCCKPEITELRLQNVLRSEKFVRQIDAMLLSLKRRPLKNVSEGNNFQFPVKFLTLDNQNLFYQLADLDRMVLKTETERLLQAHVYLMSLVGGEVLNRIIFHLNPPPGPDEIKVGMIVRDRHLATAVITDVLLNSALLTRASDDGLMLIVSRAQAIFMRARNQLSRILSNDQVTESIEQHLSLRRDMLAWCGEFIEYDLEKRQQHNTTMRPEQ